MDKKRMLVKQAIEEGTFPEIVYKYRSFGQYTEDIFKNNELWFSKPNDFNDPFDLKIYDKGGYSRVDVCNFLVSQGAPRKDINRLADSFMADPESFLQILEDTKNNVFERKGVFCVSKIRDDILMWSHYSDKHKGFVMGLRIEDDLDFFVTPLNVDYRADYPAISYLKEQGQIVNSCIKTKYLAWEYEKEIRIIKDVAGNCKFNKNALKEIIFGCKTSCSDKDDIKKWVKDYDYKSVQIFQANISKTNYRIDINRI